jgi:hypothetical protein
VVSFGSPPVGTTCKIQRVREVAGQAYLRDALSKGRMGSVTACDGWPEGLAAGLLSGSPDGDMFVSYGTLVARTVTAKRQLRL